jgi:hypothetical protein
LKKAPKLSAFTSGLGGAAGYNLLNPTPHTPVSDSAGVGTSSAATSPAGTINFDTTPDWSSLISQDPAYLMAQQGVQGSNLDAAAARTASVRHLLEQYGNIPSFGGLNVKDPSDPSGQGFLDEDVNQSTRDLAASNQAAGTSTLGKLDFTHTQNLANLRALMASQGIGGGGQQSLLETNEGRDYAGNVDSAQSSLFDALQKAQNDYLSTYRTGQQTQAQALMDTTNRLQQSGAGDASHTTANLDSGFTANGAPVYKDPNGNYWNGQNQSVSSSSLQSTAPPPAASAPPGATTYARGGAAVAN